MNLSYAGRLRMSIGRCDMLCHMYENFGFGVEPRAFHDALYQGAIGLFNGLDEMRDIVAFTRTFLEDRFSPHPPPEIHGHVARSLLPELLNSVQRDYGASNVVKELWTRLFVKIGLEARQVARDRLVIRFVPPIEPGVSTPWNRSTSTVGFHRDTWGTNLYSQVNWWAPVYPLSAGRTFALFPSLWDIPVPNTSRDFDLAEAMNRVRAARPDLRAADLLPQVLCAIDPSGARPVTIEPGSVIAFSAQHAHAGVANHTQLTRISFETRTLWIDDVMQPRGAPNMDGCASLMAPGLFRRLSDGVPLAELLGVSPLARFAGPWPAAPHRSNGATTR